jgi:hypothetical protein
MYFQIVKRHASQYACRNITAGRDNRRIDIVDSDSPQDIDIGGVTHRGAGDVRSDSVD